MKMLRLLAVTAVWLLSSGCQTVNTDYDRPARIVNPDAGSRAALQAAVNEALGRQVMLADTALTESSFLTIERSPAGTMDNPVPQGRILEKPIQFRLVINGSDCALIDGRDGARYLLENTSCKAE